MKIPRLLPLVVVALVAAPVSFSQTDPAEGSRANLKALGGAVKAYGLLYAGKRPEKIDALLDEGLVQGANVFAIPGHPIPARADVDTKGDYTLEPLPDGADLLVREKNESHTPGKVLAIFKDGSIRALTAPGGGNASTASAPAPAPPPVSTAAAPTPSVSMPTVASAPPPVAPPPPAPSIAMTSSAPAPTASPPPPVQQPMPISQTVPPPAVASNGASPGQPGVAVRGDIPPEMMAALMQFLKAQGGAAAAQTQTTTTTTTTTSSTPRNFDMQSTPDGGGRLTLQPNSGTQPVTLTIPPTQNSDGSVNAGAVAMQMLAAFGQGVAERQRKTQQDQDAAIAAGNAAAADPIAALRAAGYRGPDMSAFYNATKPPAPPSATPAPTSSTVSVNVGPGASAPTANSSPIGSAPAPGQWRVTNQLVVDLPWRSATWPEQQVRDAVAAAEATPDQRLVDALNDLAGWYRGQGRFQDAYDTYFRVQDIQMKRGLDKHADLALTYNNEGVIQIETKGRLGVTILQAAITQWEKYGTTPLPTEDYAVTLHNYARACRADGDARTADAYEAKALKVMETRRQAIGN